MTVPGCWQAPSIPVARAPPAASERVALHRRIIASLSKHSAPLASPPRIISL
jgi:hypothetical protein